jgi:hypothetical protein
METEVPLWRIAQKPNFSAHVFGRVRAWGVEHVPGPVANLTGPEPYVCDSPEELLIRAHRTICSKSYAKPPGAGTLREHHVADGTPARV